MSLQQPIRQRTLTRTTSARLGAFLLGLRRLELEKQAPAIDPAVLEETLDRLEQRTLPPMLLARAQTSAGSFFHCNDLTILKDGTTAVVNIIGFSGSSSGHQLTSIAGLGKCGKAFLLEFTLSAKTDTRNRYLDAGFWSDRDPHGFDDVLSPPVWLLDSSLWLIEWSERALSISITLVDDDLEPVLIGGAVVRTREEFTAPPAEFSPIVGFYYSGDATATNFRIRIFPVRGS